MKRYFTALLLLSLLTAFTGCEMLESVVPEPDQPDAPDPTAGGWCRVYTELGADTITQGSYLGFTIGQKPRNSHALMQNLVQRNKIAGKTPITLETADLALFEKTLPLYNAFALRQGEYPSPMAYFELEKGKVTAISQYDQPPLTQWPASELASLTIRVGDAAETIYPKLLALKEKPAYAAYFNSLIFSQSDLSLGYDPAMASVPEWQFRTPTGDRLEDEVTLQFEQGSLSTIIVRHTTYY